MTQLLSLNDLELGSRYSNLYISARGPCPVKFDLHSAADGARERPTPHLAGGRDPHRICGGSSDLRSSLRKVCNSRGERESRPAGIITRGWSDVPFTAVRKEERLSRLAAM